MHPVLGTCPVCGEPLAVTRLHCRACDTTIEGRFYAGRLAQLTPEQFEFIEVFLECEGKIKAVEQKLGISYPTVRSRLQEVRTAMGFEASDEAEEEVSDGARKRVLEDLSAGNISSDEAVTLLGGGK